MPQMWSMNTQAMKRRDITRTGTGPTCKYQVRPAGRPDVWPHLDAGRVVRVEPPHASTGGPARPHWCCLPSSAPSFAPLSDSSSSSPSSTGPGSPPCPGRSCSYRRGTGCWPRHLSTALSVTSSEDKISKYQKMVGRLKRTDMVCQCVSQSQLQVSCRVPLLGRTAPTQRQSGPGRQSGEGRTLL